MAGWSFWSCIFVSRGRWDRAIYLRTGSQDLCLALATQHRNTRRAHISPKPPALIPSHQCRAPRNPKVQGNLLCRVNRPVGKGICLSSQHPAPKNPVPKASAFPQQKKAALRYARRPYMVTQHPAGLQTADNIEDFVQLAQNLHFR